jgi:hypothetical protein
MPRPVRPVDAPAPVMAESRMSATALARPGGLGLTTCDKKGYPHASSGKAERPG